MIYKQQGKGKKKRKKIKENVIFSTNSSGGQHCAKCCHLFADVHRSGRKMCVFTGTRDSCLAAALICSVWFFISFGFWRAIKKKTFICFGWPQTR